MKMPRKIPGNVRNKEVDLHYTEKRQKNNEQARRSREAKRLKENQICLRTAFLQQQLTSLESAVQVANKKNNQLLSENKILIQMLKRYGMTPPFLRNQTNVPVR